MEFLITITDERLNDEIIADAMADIHGLQAILRKFTCAKQRERTAMLERLSRGEEANYYGSQHHQDDRYSVWVRPVATPEQMLLNAIFSGEEGGVEHAAQDADRRSHADG